MARNVHINRVKKKTPMRSNQLTARVSADASGIALNELQLDAGALNAGGALRHTPDGRLEGRLTIEVRSSVAAIKVPVRVSGLLPNAEVMVER